MKKTLFNLFAAALVLSAGVSCNKTETPTTKERTPITITATIGSGEDTKISYTEEGNVLKTAWETSETITVITLRYNTIVTVDNFTYEGEGGKTVDFTGTLSPGASDDIRIVYPALEQYQDETGAVNFGTPRPKYPAGDKYRLISGVRVEGKTMTFDSNNSIQAANGSTAHLKDALVYLGEGTLSGNTMTVDVAPISSVIKITFTLPEEAKTKACNKVDIVADNDGIGYEFNSCGYSFEDLADGPFDYFYGWESTLSLDNGSYLIPIDGADELTVYVPFIPGTAGKVFGPAGNSVLKYWLSTDDTDEDLFYKEGSVTLSNNLTLEPGKMYRLNIDLSE